MRLAADAFMRFGRGRHPAALNFGDCLAYATARSLGDALFFVGDDFAKTDVGSARSIPGTTRTIRPTRTTSRRALWVAGACLVISSVGTSMEYPWQPSL